MSAPEERPEPEVVLMPQQIVGEFLARQTLVGTFGSKEVRFEAALQKQGGALTVVGLTPLGNKAFTLVHKGEDQLEFENQLPNGKEELPLKPKYLLADIHHAFFLSADPAAPEVGGWRKASHGKEYVYEERIDGDLHLAFTPKPGSKRRVAVVRSAEREGGFPRRVTLDNGYYGYRLEIETVSFQGLE